MEAIENPYKILEITETATDEEIKAAYRRMAKKYHPDAHPGNKEFEKKFRQISEAYSILGNPSKKKKYDQNIKKPKKPKTQSNKCAATSYNSQFSRKTNPLDTTDLFERFMGIKR